MEKDFDKWNNVKKEISCISLNKNFSERDVWFIKIGLNIGYEQDGKGEESLRPVLVLRKFSKRVFLGIPLTRVEKELPFYHSFEFKGNKSTAILSQIRLFDTKRLKFRYGKISKHDFMDIKKNSSSLFNEFDFLLLRREGLLCGDLY
jgi:mRNA-degrading endonuclease toxin of MazEF toxin-antitoxin module